MNVLFLVARALHVLCAALWLGGVTMLVFYVTPAAESMGPDAGKFMGAMQRGGIHIFMSAISGLTVLLGLYLYWHFTAGFDPTISRSTGGIVFGIGGVLGIVSLVIGGVVVGGSAKALTELAEAGDGRPGHAHEADGRHGTPAREDADLWPPRRGAGDDYDDPDGGRALRVAAA